jgi:Domain of unknown function (DUF3943)
MAIRTVVLTCVTLVGATAFLRADPAPQAVPEQEPSGSLLTRALELMPPSTDSSVEDAEGGEGRRIENDSQQPFDWRAERRACEGCPRRSVGRALLQTTLINVVYEMANLVRGQVTARITPKTWWDNMENGWVWDLDDFEVNQVGHPYQGNNYFTSGRANGLSFYESAALAAFGSGTWEYFGETNKPSVNDFINTTLGGIALGEMFHRAAWLVRDTQATGRARLWREIGATAIDPLTGYNRFRTGDAKRITGKPADMVPSTLAGFTSAGVLWRGSEGRAIDSAGQPFLEVDMLYGDARTGRSRMPYDAFSVRLRLGGGSGFSEARVRGRLLGQPLGSGKVQFTAMQSYDYQTNDAYATGAQSFEGAFGVTQPLSSRTDVWLLGWGGVTVLGAVDNLPLGITERPPRPEGPGGGQGVSEGPRFYDYGPGSTFGAVALLSRDHRLAAALLYEGRHLYSLDGVRANHFLQRARLDLLLPLRGSLGIGASGEYFFRQTFYQDEKRSQLEYRYPQFRAYLTWSLQ